MHTLTTHRRMRLQMPDRTTLALGWVFLLAAAFFTWRSIFAQPLSLHLGESAGESPAYNQLDNAFLHLRLWVAHIPAQLLGPEPLNPARRPAVLAPYIDYALKGEYVYVTWGPAPVLILLVPLHILGFAPSASITMIPFALGGLGFALATLRVLLREIGGSPWWMPALAGLTLMCASVVPYLLVSSDTYFQAVVAGYGFAMAGIWLAVSTIVRRRASMMRLISTSLCFGLATGSRPTLIVTALILAPVYASLRESRSRRSLVGTLGIPFGVCVLLLAAYDQARFGSPLNYGTIDQINGAGGHPILGELGFIPPGLWGYLMTPPRLDVLFPFLSLAPFQPSYPLSLPTSYSRVSEETGGLLTMAPIAIFLIWLPWLWRRHPETLGRLAHVLLAIVIAGIICMLLLSYEFAGTTERYEADYTGLLLFGALAAWLVLSTRTSGRVRRAVRASGAVLAIWSCIAGIALSVQGFQTHDQLWRTLVNAGSPVSTAMAAIVGHPILAEVSAKWANHTTFRGYANLGAIVSGAVVGPGEQIDLTIVSPSSREVVLTAEVHTAPSLTTGKPGEISIAGPAASIETYRFSHEGTVGFPIHVRQGVNRFVFSPATGRGMEVVDIQIGS